MMKERVGLKVEGPDRPFLPGGVRADQGRRTCCSIPHRRKVAEGVVPKLPDNSAYLRLHSPVERVVT